MKILVIGGTGFIGPYVVRFLSEQGHDLTLFHRGQTDTDLPARVTHLNGDREHLDRFRADFARLAPDVVLHIYAIGERDAQLVMRSFVGITRRVVAISSGDVYRAYGRLWRTEPGPPDPVPLTEDSPLREKLYPLRGIFDGEDDYDKLLVERSVLGNPSLPGTILRLPMVYGPGDGHRIFPYLKRVDDGRPAILLDEAQARWRWSRGYVENVALAIALAVIDDRATGRVYNVAEPDALSEAAWVEQISNVVGWKERVVTVPKGSLLRKHDLDWAQHWVVDTQRIRAELGYREIVPRDEALRRAIAWERAHPPAEIDPADFEYPAEDRVLRRLETDDG